MKEENTSKDRSASMLKHCRNFGVGILTIATISVLVVAGSYGAGKFVESYPFLIFWTPMSFPLSTSVWGFWDIAFNGFRALMSFIAIGGLFLLFCLGCSQAGESVLEFYSKHKGE